ncbi:hypothetical protein VTO42DRAFT_5765 [Malbranchea cinnamomea]
MGYERITELSLSTTCPILCKDVCGQAQIQRTSRISLGWLGMILQTFPAWDATMIQVAITAHKWDLRLKAIVGITTLWH